MKTIELDMYQATAVAALVLLLGRVLVAKISILRRYCIPAPVVGGFPLCNRSYHRKRHGHSGNFLRHDT